MLLYIKNMVCPRCIRTVERLLADQDLPVKNVELGEVELFAPPTVKGDVSAEEVAAVVAEAGFQAQEVVGAV